jgi:hypothetical protein
VQEKKSRATLLSAGPECVGTDWFGCGIGSVCLGLTGRVLANWGKAALLLGK